MGSIIEAIYDDIEEYRWMCKTLGEDVRVTPTHQGISVEDCYGKHAKWVEARVRRGYTGTFEEFCGNVERGEN
jgi:hypothetical protein